MTDTPDPYDFEHYQPRQPVSIPISRRGLLRAMITELDVYSEKVDGKPTMKTADLASLADEELAQIRPVREPECKISLRDQLVWAKPAGSLEPLALFPAASPALRVFNLFNGENDLRTASQALAADSGWPEEKSWAYTRGLFLKLVSQRVCVPK